MDLTEEEKERLKGYSKVAKKLQKMESTGQHNRYRIIKKTPIFNYNNIFNQYTWLLLF